MDKKMDYNVALLKVIACIAVIGLHTFQKDISFTLAMLYYLCGFAIPIFFMCSGFVLLNRGEIRAEYCINKVIIIFRVIVCWNILYFALYIYLKRNTLNLSFRVLCIQLVKNIILGLFQGGFFWWFWYLGVLMGIYVILRCISYKKLKYIISAICFIIMIVIQFLSMYIGFPLQKNVVQSLRIWTWLFYFCMGGILGEKRKIRFTSNWKKLLCITIIAILYQIFVGHTIIRTSINDNVALHAEYFYDSIFTVIWCLTLFKTIMETSISNYLRIWIDFFHPLIMGMYIIHPIVIKIVKYVIEPINLCTDIAYFVCVLLCTLIIVIFLNKIKVGRYLIHL